MLCYIYIYFFFCFLFLSDITKLRLQSVADVARQVEAELEEKTRLQTEQHQAQLAQLASDTERILSLEKELAELALQHGRELEKATERHTAELRELEDAVSATRLCRSHASCTNALVKQSHALSDGEMTCLMTRVLS